MLKKLSLRIGIPVLLLLVLLSGKGIKVDTFIFSEVSTTISHPTSTASPNKSSLYTFFKLILPEAVVSPATSFQFGIVESFCLFLFAFFLLCSVIKVAEVSPLFVYSYIRNLFSTLILINAP